MVLKLLLHLWDEKGNVIFVKNSLKNIQGIDVKFSLKDIRRIDMK